MLVPDQTPDNPNFEDNEIPRKAAHCVIWLLSFQYSGRVWVDDVALEPYDPRAAWCRELHDRLDRARWIEQREQAVALTKQLNGGHPVARRMAETVRRLDKLLAVAKSPSNCTIAQIARMRVQVHELLEQCGEGLWAGRTVLLLDGVDVGPKREDRKKR